MIKIGDSLPATTLMEYSGSRRRRLQHWPEPVPVDKATAGKTIALFALLVRLRRPARPSMCPAIWRKPPSSRLRV